MAERPEPREPIRGIEESLLQRFRRAAPPAVADALRPFLELPRREASS